MQRGRPSDYVPGYCEVLVDIMSEGKSLAAVAKAIGVTRKTLYDWAAKHDEFADAIEAGKDMSLAFWEDQAMDVAFGVNSGNASVLNFQMKNRFRSDYQDTIDNRISGGDGPAVQSEHTIKFVMPDHADD